MAARSPMACVAIVQPASAKRLRGARQLQRVPEQHAVVSGMHVGERRAQRARAGPDPAVGVELHADHVDVGVLGAVAHAFGGESAGDEDAHAARQPLGLAAAQQRVEVLPVVHARFGDLADPEFRRAREPRHELRVETLVERVAHAIHRRLPAAATTRWYCRDRLRRRVVVRRLHSRAHAQQVRVVVDEPGTVKRHTATNITFGRWRSIDDVSRRCSSQTPAKFDAWLKQEPRHVRRHLACASPRRPAPEKDGDLCRSRRSRAVLGLDRRAGEELDDDY